MARSEHENNLATELPLKMASDDQAGHAPASPAESDSSSEALGGKMSELSVFGHVFRSVCNELTRMVYGEAWLYHPAPNGQGVLDCYEAFYIQAPYINQAQSFRYFRNVCKAMRFREGEGMPGRMIKFRTPEWLVDVSMYPKKVFLRKEAAAQVGFKAAFGLPLFFADSRPYGVLMFFSFGRHEIDPVVINYAFEHTSAAFAPFGLVVGSTAPLFNRLYVNPQDLTVFEKREEDRTDAELDSLTSKLKDLSLFRRFEHLTRPFCRAARLRKYGPYETVFKAGEVGSTSYVIVRGSVQILEPENLQDGYVLHSSETIGEAALLANQVQRDVTAITLEETWMLEIDLNNIAPADRPNGASAAQPSPTKQREESEPTFVPAAPETPSLAPADLEAMLNDILCNPSPSLPPPTPLAPAPATPVPAGAAPSSSGPNPFALFNKNVPGMECHKWDPSTPVPLQEPSPAWPPASPAAPPPSGLPHPAPVDMSRFAPPPVPAPITLQTLQQLQALSPDQGSDSAHAPPQTLSPSPVGPPVGDLLPGQPLALPPEAPALSLGPPTQPKALRKGRPEGILFAHEGPTGGATSALAAAALAHGMQPEPAAAVEDEMEDDGDEGDEEVDVGPAAAGPSASSSAPAFTPGAPGEKPEKRVRPKKKTASHITYEILAQHFTVPIKEASAKLGFSTTTLKKLCRKFGVKKWPFRQLAVLDDFVVSCISRDLCSTVAAGAPGGPPTGGLAPGPASSFPAAALAARRPGGGAGLPGAPPSGVPSFADIQAAVAAAAAQAVQAAASGAGEGAAPGPSGAGTATLAAAAAAQAQAQLLETFLKGISSAAAEARANAAAATAAAAAATAAASAAAAAAGGPAGPPPAGAGAGGLPIDAAGLQRLRAALGPTLSDADLSAYVARSLSGGAHPDGPPGPSQLSGLKRKVEAPGPPACAPLKEEEGVQRLDIPDGMQKGRVMGPGAFFRGGGL